MPIEQSKPIENPVERVTTVGVNEKEEPILTIPQPDIVVTKQELLDREKMLLNALTDMVKAQQDQRARLDAITEKVTVINSELGEITKNLKMFE